MSTNHCMNQPTTIKPIVDRVGARGGERSS
jgi:hypothetical protein